MSRCRTPAWPRRRAAAATDLGCALAFLGALALAACNEVGRDEPPPDPPRLAFSETTHDFGRVPQGTVVERRFPFVNAGGSDLSIMNLRAACDCEATLLGPDTIPPGGSGVVQARFRTDETHGAQRRTVTVYSNDPVDGAITLSLTGEVALDVVADPPAVYLGVVPPDAPAIREVAIRSGHDGVRVGPARTTAPQLALELTAVPTEPRTARLTIGTAPGAALGPFTAVVEIPTTSATHPMLRIAVGGIIAADAPTPRARVTPPTPLPTAAPGTPTVSAP